MCIGAIGLDSTIRSPSMSGSSSPDSCPQGLRPRGRQNYRIKNSTRGEYSAVSPALGSLKSQSEVIVDQTSNGRRPMSFANRGSEIY